VTPKQVGQAVQVLRWLASELAGERHPLAHVPQQVAAALLSGPGAGCCRLCGGPLPMPALTGRPRVRCERCSPSRRKLSAKSRMAA
jgi:hypothetical protein